jgi:uncharacterized protein (DUF1697 family)
MPRYIALLRSVNVGGAGKLPMAELKAICFAAGFRRVETLIASGNVAFDSDASPIDIRSALAERLRAHAGKPVGVFLRDRGEIRAVLEQNPFAERAADRTVAIFLDGPPPRDALEHVRYRRDEESRLGAREIYVHYPSGQGRSRLIIPAAEGGTARNMNTVARLVALAEKP